MIIFKNNYFIFKKIKYYFITFIKSLLILNLTFKFEILFLFILNLTLRLKC